MSWNIFFGEEVETAVVELQAIDALRNADVVLLQEMDVPGTERIAGALGADFAYFAAAPHERSGRDFGNAIVSRWPMTAGREVPMPHRAKVQGQPRSATRAAVEVDGVSVLFYSTHTEVPRLSLPKRIEQFDRLSGDAADDDSPRVVVGGDFNTATRRSVDALVRSMQRAELSRVSTEALFTYSRAGKDFTLDHIFARGLRAVGSGVARETTASDHLPIWVDLEIAN